VEHTPRGPYYGHGFELAHARYVNIYRYPPLPLAGLTCFFLSLEELAVAGNVLFTGTIPTEIGNLGQLRKQGGMSTIECYVLFSNRCTWF
jgi:hypothetical protein